MDEKLIRILSELSMQQYKTSSFLALTLHLSEKTIRTRIKDLESLICNQGARIVSKQGKGYILEIYNPDLYNAFINRIKMSQTIIPINSDERVLFLLNLLLWVSDYVKLDDLADRLFISKSTLTNDMKKVENKLDEYNIHILRKPYYGIKVEATEMEIRLCLVNQIVKRNRLKNTELENLQYQIGLIVKDVLYTQHIYASEMTMHNIILHISLAILRIQKNYVIPYSSFLHKWVEEMTLQTKQAACEIVSQIQNQLNIDFPIQEIDYITIHLAGKRVIADEIDQEPNFIISPEIYGLATEMINTIFENYKIDLRNDFNLIISLSKHLVPLDIRLRYDMILENPLLEDIKKQYAYSFAIATQAVVPIIMRYGKKLNENEIGYIALILAVSLETSHNIEKKNILMVCNDGKYIGKLLAYRYQEEFSQYIDEIKVCNLHELTMMSLKNIDYILTTTPIKMNISIPILEIRTFLEDEEILSLKKTFSQDDEKSYMHYFDELLFFTDIKCQGKQEVLSYMCQQISRYREIPPYFLESVLEREELSSTDFGELVAMPHPNALYTQEDFACVGLLSHPVFWGVREVQCIILIAISENQSNDFEDFFYKISHFAMDKYKVMEVLKSHDYHQFIHLLEQG